MKNLEERRGKPARIVLGDPLPDEVEILPSPERLEECCSVAGESGRIEEPSLSRIGDALDEDQVAFVSRAANLSRSSGRASSSSTADDDAVRPRAPLDPDYGTGGRGRARLGAASE